MPLLGTFLIKKTSGVYFGGLKLYRHKTYVSKIISNHPLCSLISIYKCEIEKLHDFEKLILF